MTPLLLLVPGLLNTPRVFDRLRAAWPQAPEIVVADIREQDSIEALARAAWAVVEGVDAARPLVVAGFSLGGYVALQMMAQAPRRARGLGLICTSARAESPQGVEQRERTVAAIERDFPRHVDKLAGFLLSPQGLRDTALLAEVRADMLACGAATAVRQHRAAAGRADQRGFVTSLGLPVQIVCGGADPVTPPQASVELATLIRGARLETVTGAGHLLPYEHPARLAAALAGLVQRATAALATQPGTDR